MSALTDFIHERLDEDQQALAGLPSGQSIIDPLRMLVESRPAVKNPAAFEDVEAQREHTWKCVALIWEAHPDWREEWRP